MKLTKEQIAAWVEDNMFGQRFVKGVGRISLTNTQEVMKMIFATVICEWEEKKGRKMLEEQILRGSK